MKTSFRHFARETRVGLESQHVEKCSHIVRTNYQEVSGLKDKIGYILCFSYLQQIPRKDQNQQRASPSLNTHRRPHPVSGTRPSTHLFLLKVQKPKTPVSNSYLKNKGG